MGVGVLLLQETRAFQVESCRLNFASDSKATVQSYWRCQGPQSRGIWCAPAAPQLRHFHDALLSLL